MSSSSFTRRTVGYGVTPPGSGAYQYFPQDRVVMKWVPEAEGNTFSEKVSPLVCELFGTFMLALTYGFAVALGDPSWGPAVVGAVLMVLITAVEHISGGNLNPAVSLSLGFVGKLQWPKVFRYIIVQFIGGFLAALLMYFSFDVTLSIEPNKGFGLITPAFCEIFYAFVLGFVVLNCAASNRNNPKFDGNQFSALAIGLVIIAGGYASGPISGAVFNPAIAVGYGVFHMASGFIYVIYHLVGACFAAMLFKAVRPEDYQLETEFAVSHYQPTIESKCLSEFLGTTVLLVTAGLNVCTMATREETGWSLGAALACMIFSLGDVSGGHFNPAVSLAVWLCGRSKLSAATALLYVIMQLMAAIICGFLTSFIHDRSSYDNKVYGFHPGTGSTWSQVVISELLFSFLLCWVVLSVGTTSLAYPGNVPPPKRSFYAAFAIGLCMTVPYYLVGNISGGILNPAIELALQVEVASASTNVTQNIVAIVNATEGPLQSPVTITAETFIPDNTNFVWYSLIQCGGALLAGIIFHISHAHEYHAKNSFPH